MESITEYEIRCTEEQTKKAFELGALIELLPNYTEFSGFPFVKCQDDNMRPCVPPTAEQMIGWLRSKGLRFKIDELSDTIVTYRVTSDYWYRKGQSNNPKGAIHAVIDAALEYLINNKELL